MNLTWEERMMIQKHRRKEETRNEKRVVEFSKKIMFFVMSTAFLVIAFAIYIINKTSNTTYLDVLISETLAFAKIGVGFYSAKAATENVFKIRKNNEIRIESSDERGE